MSIHTKSASSSLGAGNKHPMNQIIPKDCNESISLGQKMILPFSSQVWSFFRLVEQIPRLTWKVFEIPLGYIDLLHLLV